MERAFRNAGVSNPLQRARDGEEVARYLKGIGPYADRKRFPLPALLIVDLKMPRMDGFEVIKWVRSTHPFRRLPIVVMTTSVRKADINRAHDLGANSYLVKPGRFEELTEAIKMAANYWLNFSARPEIE